MGLNNSVSTPSGETEILLLRTPEAAGSDVSAMGGNGVTLLRKHAHHPAGQSSHHPAAEEFLAPGREFLARQLKNSSMKMIADEELETEKSLGESRLQRNPSDGRRRLHDAGANGGEFFFNPAIYMYPSTFLCRSNVIQSLTRPCTKSRAGQPAHDASRFPAAFAL